MQILYFAHIRTRLDRASEEFALPAEVTTVSGLLDHLAARDERFAAVIGDRKAIRIAVNQDFATPDTPVKDSDEVAIFPPVTGG